jgi:ankyrin repeat protein
LEEIEEQNWEYAHRLFQCVAVASRPLFVNELAEFLAFDFEAGSTPSFLADWRPEDPAHSVLSLCSSLLAVVKPRSGSPVVQFAHFSVKEYLTSVRLAKAKDTISRFHVFMTPAHTIVARACLGVLLYLDENVTKDGLENFPLAEYAAEYWVGHARFDEVSSKVQDGMKCLFDPSKNHLSVWAWVCDPENPRLRTKRSESPLKARATPLHYAALCGLLDVVKFLIVEHSQDVNARGFEKEETPLYVASRRRHVDVAQLLLEHGADAKTCNRFGNSPLRLASQGGQVELARVLLKHGADTESRREELSSLLSTLGKSPLLLALEEGHVGVARVLLEYGANTEARDDRKCTPLFLASQGGLVEFVRVLLEHGADTEARGYMGFSALELASSSRHVEVVQALLEHGADVKAQDGIKRTPLHFAQEGEEVARALLEHGADVKARDKYDQTPLHLARREEVARLLLKYGADANALDNEGRTPLHHASEQGYVGPIRVFLEHGVDANIRDANNSTPLHMAAQHTFRPNDGRLNVIRLLLQYNSDVHARDDMGRTPFMIAEARGVDSVLQLLSEQGTGNHRM